MRAAHVWAVAAAVFAGVALVAGGCASTGGDEGGDGGAVVRRGAPPAYAEVAAAYNERLAPLDSLFASTSVRLRYIDEEGERREEQGEGRLQVVLPDRLALSITKAGKRLFWFGGDAEHYWWFDLVNARVASIGRHENFDRAARERLGLAIHPLDLIRVLGILPLPVDAGVAGGGGATQWSDDGRLLGVTTRIRNEGYQRVWLNPERLEPVKIELYDSQRRLAVVADLEEHDYVAISGIGGGGPRVAKRVSVFDVGSGTEVRLSMDPPSDGSRIDPDAFNFGALRELLGVERVINLDEARAAAGAELGLEVGAEMGAGGAAGR